MKEILKIYYKKKKLNLRNKSNWKENIKREEDEMFKKIIKWRKFYINIKGKVFAFFAFLLFKNKLCFILSIWKKNRKNFR